VALPALHGKGAGLACTVTVKACLHAGAGHAGAGHACTQPFPTLKILLGMFPVNRKKIWLTGFLLTEPKPTRWWPSWHLQIAVHQ